jgi:hypothetical protein
LFVACVTYQPPALDENAQDASAPSSSSSSGGVVSDAGGARDASELTDGGALPQGDAPSECSTLAQLGQSVTLRLGNGPAPSAIGGTPSGTYVLAQARVYAPLLPVQKNFPATTIKMNGLVFDMLRGNDSTNSGTVTIANSAVTFNATCGSGNEFTGSTFTYSVSAQLFKLYTPVVVPNAGTFTMEFIFTKQ